MSSVSVIIPYFRKKKFFRKTINSVLNQSYQKIEIILIYDDEDLNDLKFIKKIIKKDKRIKLLINKKNIGAGLSRNFGASESSGNYLAFIDADDVWKKNKLELQVNEMIKNDWSVSHTSYKIINKSDKIIGKRTAKTFYNYKSLLKSCDIGCSTVMMKRELLNSNICFPKLKTKEDFVLWLKILKKKKIFFAINKPLVYWRKNEGSLSSSFFQKVKDGFNVYNKFMKFNYLKSFYYLILLSINFLLKNLNNK